MALINVITWGGRDTEVAWKFPSTNLRLGSQLVVKPGQSAFFVYRGKVCDEITEGTITLKTGNIPTLTSLLSLPFGGDTPFQAEVWFINRLAKLDTKWGTPTPIQFWTHACITLNSKMAIYVHSLPISLPSPCMHRAMQMAMNTFRLICLSITKVIKKP